MTRGRRWNFYAAARRDADGSKTKHDVSITSIIYVEFMDIRSAYRRLRRDADP